MHAPRPPAPPRAIGSPSGRPRLPHDGSAVPDDMPKRHVQLDIPAKHHSTLPAPTSQFLTARSVHEWSERRVRTIGDLDADCKALRTMFAVPHDN